MLTQLLQILHLLTRLLFSRDRSPPNHNDKKPCNHGDPAQEAMTSSPTEHRHHIGPHLISGHPPESCNTTPLLHTHIRVKYTLSANQNPQNWGRLPPPYTYIYILPYYLHQWCACWQTF